MKYSEDDLKKFASPIGKTEEEKCKNAILMVRDALKNIMPVKQIADSDSLKFVENKKYV